MDELFAKAPIKKSILN
ncbi:Protein of unknown function [Lactobacillus helveticus CIRM-BIA 103]|nr:Protein of unknown function [Lactobacillus helveticus CIRM-BIA 103]